MCNKVHKFGKMKNKAIKWLDFINPGNDIGFKPAAKKRTSVQREGILQAQFVEWFRYQYPTLLMVSSVNGAVLEGDKVKRGRRWMILEKEGAVPGASDLFLFFATGGYHGLCVEMKQGTGKQQKTQKDFQAKVESFGYKYVLCRTLEQAQDEVKNYLHGRTDNTMGNGQIFDSER